MMHIGKSSTPTFQVTRGQHTKARQGRVVQVQPLTVPRLTPLTAHRHPWRSSVGSVGGRGGVGIAQRGAIVLAAGAVRRSSIVAAAAIVCRRGSAVRSWRCTRGLNAAVVDIRGWWESVIWGL